MKNVIIGSDYGDGSGGDDDDDDDDTQKRGFWNDSAVQTG